MTARTDATTVLIRYPQSGGAVAAQSVQVVGSNFSGNSATVR